MVNNGYSELVDINLGENQEELLQAKEQACNEKLFVELGCNQKFCLTWNRTTSMWAFLKINDHIVLIDCFKSQRMKCVVCHNIQ